MKKKNLLILLVSIGIIILPVVIDWLILGNEFPSNISNSDWASFFGGYIGALVSGIISLVGIAWTIRFTREQNQKERELQVKPYCTIKFENTEKFVGTDKSLGYYYVSFEPYQNHGPEKNGLFFIKNYGIGPAIDCSIVIEEIDNGRKQHSSVLYQFPNQKNKSVTCINPGDEVSASLNLAMNFDKIQPEEILFDPNKPEPILKRGVVGKYKDFEINLRFIYHDILHNEYEQKIKMKVNIYTSVSQKELAASYECDLILVDIEKPIKK